MSITPPQAVDWSDWASQAAPRTCPACQREFQPNVPRRRYCGLPDCPGRQRTRKRRPRRRPTEPVTPPVDRSTVIHGLFGNALVQINGTKPPDGTKTELAGALRLMVLAEKAGDVAGQERAIVAIVASSSVRLYQTRSGSRPPA